MSKLKIMIGSHILNGLLEDKSAPLTCEFFKKMLPLKNKIIHVRWSGEAVWIPYGNLHTNIPYENATSYLLPGQMVLYPGGISETEMMLAYGCCHFASKCGELTGNHFLTITDNLDLLREIGNDVLYNGAADIKIELCR